MTTNKSAADVALSRDTQIMVDKIRMWIEEWGYEMPIGKVDKKIAEIITQAVKSETQALAAELIEARAEVEKLRENQAFPTISS